MIITTSDSPATPLRERFIEDMNVRRLALARELLKVAEPREDPSVDDPLDHRPPCPCCGGHMIVVETFERWQQPRAPPTAIVPIGELAP
jgi:hypothetical protein